MTPTSSDPTCPNLRKRELVRLTMDLHPDWPEMFCIDHVSRLLANAHADGR